MMDYIAVEYVGPKMGGFSVPAPSGNRYRFLPPHRRVVQASREDAVFFLSKAGYRIVSAATLGPAVQRAAPISDPIRVSDFQTGGRVAPTSAQAAAMAAVASRVASAPPAPRRAAPAQVVEQTVERGREMAPPPIATAPAVSPARAYNERKARVPRSVDERKTPQWKPNI